MSTPSTSTILIVDDYPDALEVWGFHLRAAGFSVLTAANGLAALVLATEKHPDLIVLDLELPGKSGTEVAATLRAQPSTRDIPLIAATGDTRAKQIDLARRTGFNAIVIKPCDPDALLKEIRRLLHDRQESSSLDDRNEAT